MMEGTTEKLSPAMAARPSGLGDREFEKLNAWVGASFLAALTDSRGVFFRVPSRGLDEVFLDAFEDPVERQFHNCMCCRSFIRRHGGLVVIDEALEMRTALWRTNDEAERQLAPPFFQAVRALEREVERRAVVNVARWKESDSRHDMTGENLWGAQHRGGFPHFCVLMPPSNVNALQTAGQAQADLHHRFVTLSKAVAVMKGPSIGRAVALCEHGSLVGADKLLPMGTFLRDVQARANAERGERRRRVLWRAVATAPAGWCTPRGSAFGALVEDVESGASIEEISRRQRLRMGPENYQRPKAAPSEGNIGQAEKIFTELGLERALERRPMAFEEAQCFWVPPVAVPLGGGGIFSHLRPGTPEKKSDERLASGTEAITWARFERTVMPKAQRMTVLCPAHGNYCALTTAVHADAPPLYRWDKGEKRNPGAWYVHTKGSSRHTWALGPTASVLGLCRLPSEWQEGHGYGYGPLVLFVLEGARDSSAEGVAIFPSSLRTELHSVRSTIEAFSQSRQFAPEPRARASGLLFQPDRPVDVEVTTDSGKARYRLDRID